MAVIGSRFSSLFNDSNGDAKVSPGDVLLTQIVITNATATPLTTVVVNDTLTANTTYVPGTIIVTTGDTYALTGNTPITFGTAQGLLANDYHGDGANVNTSTGLSVALVNGTGIGGAITVHDAANNALTAGSVTVGADGSFTFTPAAGYTGTAAFSYAISDGTGLVGSATVHLGVTGLVWYVDSSAAGGGNGTFANPFNTLASVTTVDHANDTVVLHGTVTTAAAFVMKAGEILYGDGSTFSVNSHQITNAGTDSTINHSAGAITLASGNTIDGVDLTGTAAAATGLTDGGATVGNLTINHMAIGGQGQILDIDQGGNLNVALKSATSTGFSGAATGGAIDLESVSGNLTIAGATSISGTQASGGIQVTGSLVSSLQGATSVDTSATGTAGVTLGGTANTSFASLAVTSAGGAALTTTGGTLAVTAGTIATTTGAAVNMSATAIAAGGVTFSTINASGTVANAHGINLDNVDGGTFNGGAVTVAGTSGTVAAQNADGIHIANGSTANFTFASATLGDATHSIAGDAIDLSGANGAVTFTTVNINNVGGDGVVITGATNGVTIGGGTIGNTNDPTGIDLHVVNGSGAVNVAASLTKTTSGHILDISGHSSGQIDVSGAVSATGGVANGISITGNTSGVINVSNATVTLTTGANNAIDFTTTAGTGPTLNLSGGNLNIDTTTGTGLNATSTTTGAAALNITGTNNSIASVGGRAINIDGVTANVTLHDVSANGGTSTGVFLKNTGAGGQFVVTGTGTTAASGGVFNAIGGGDAASAGAAATTGTGIYMENVSNVSLSNLNFTGAFTNFGIRGEGVNNFTLKDSNLTGTFGSNTGFIEGAIRFGTQSTTNSGLSGTVLFSGDTIQGGWVHNLAVFHYGSAALTMTINDSAAHQAVFNNTDAGVQGANDVLVETGGTTNLTFASTGVTYNGSHDTNLDIVSGDQTVQNISITGNTFANTQTQTSGAANVRVSGSLQSTNTAANGIVHYTIDNNTFKGSEGANIYAMFNGSAGTITGVITNNTFGTPDGTYESAIAQRSSLNGGAFFGGIDSKFLNSGNMTYAIKFDTNTVADWGGALGFNVRSAAQDSTGIARVEATVSNNIFKEIAPGPVMSGSIGTQVAGTGNYGNVGLNIFNNHIDNTGTTAGDAIYLDNSNSVNGVLYMPGISPSPNTSNSSIAAYLTGKGNVFTGPEASAGGGVNFNGIGVTNQAFVLPVPLTATAPDIGQGWQDFVQTKPVGDPGVTTNPCDSAGGTGGTGGTSGGTGTGIGTSTGSDTGAGTGSTTTTPPTEVTSALTQDALDQMVAAAIHRWELAGATPEQVTAMKAVTVTISNIAGLEVGDSTPGHVQISTNGAGYGWFVDATPGDDNEFTGTGSDLAAAAGSAAAGHIDLLTVLEHELGHQIGLSDLYSPLATADLMYGYVNPSERRLPTSADVNAANGTAIDHEAFALAPVTLPSLAANTDVDISYRATVNSFAAGLAPTLSGQSSMTWQGLATPITASETIGRLNTTRTDSAGTITTAALTEATLTLGNLVFKDNDKDGNFGAGDTGINGVTVKLYVDSNSNGVYDAGTDALVATTTTAGGGFYTFTGLAPGDYVAVIPAANFAVGQPLNTLVTHANPLDPDNNTDNDNNGGFVGTDVASQAITLAFDTETTNGAGNDTNNTLDFGFQTNTPPTAVNDALTATNEDTPVTYAASDFTTNDSDADGDTFAITSVGNGAHGTAVLNGNGTVTYTPNANYNGPDSFSYTITDSHGGTGTATASLTVTAVNDAPVLDLDSTTAGTGVAVTTAEQNLVLPAPNATLIDIDSPDFSGGSLTVGYGGAVTGSDSVFVSDEGGQFASGGKIGVSGSNIYYNTVVIGTIASSGLGNPLIINFNSSATPAAVQELIHRVNTINISDTPPAGARTLSFTVTDGDGGSTQADASVTFTPVNDAPSGADESLHVVENATHAFTVAEFTNGYTDAENNNLKAVKIDSLPVKGSLTDNGVAVTVGQFVSTADIAAGLLVYWTDPATGGNAYNFKFQVQDNGGTANGGVDLDPTQHTYTLNVDVSNQPPVAVGEALADAYEDEATVYSEATLLAGDSDPDAGDTIHVTGASNAQHGTVSYNAATHAVTFTSTADYSGPASFDYTITDSHGATSTATETLTVQPTNDAPTIANFDGDTNTQNEDQNSDMHIDVGGDAVVADIDSTDFDGGSLVVSIVNYNGEDSIGIYQDGVLEIDASNNVLVNGVNIGTASGGYLDFPYTGTFTVTFNANATPATVQELVRHVFAGDQAGEPIGGARTVNITLTDGDGTAHGGTDHSDYSTTFTVVSVNDEPVGADKTVTINEDNAYALQTSDFGFSASANGFENDNLQAVKITTLPAAGTGTLYLDLDGAGTGSLGTAITTGQFVSAADIAAGHLVYVPAQDANGTSAASFTFQVQDDGGTANGGVDTDQSPNTITFDINAVNDAPAYSGATAGSGLEEGTISFSSAGLNTIVITDVDGSAPYTATLTVGHGTIALTASGAALVSNSGTDTVTVTGTLADVNATLDGLVYAAEENFNGTDTLHISTKDSDGTALGGSDTGTIDIPLTVAPINDAPTVVNGTTATATTIAEDTPSATGDTVSSLFLSHYSDAADQVTGGSSADAFAGVAVTGNDASGTTGQWQYYDGAAWVNVGTVSDGSALLLDASTALRFNPAQDFNGAAPALTVHLVDASAGSIPTGSTADLSAAGATGGTTAYSTGTVDLGDTVTAMNDNPVLAATGTSFSYTENDAPHAFTGTIAVSDVDNANFNGGKLVIADASPDTGDAIVLGSDPDITYNSGTGAVSYQGNVFAQATQNAQGYTLDLNANATPAAIQALIADLSFVNNSDNPIGGDHAVTFTLTDGAGGTASFTDHINVIPVNDSPTIANLDGDAVSFIENDPVVYTDTNAGGGTVHVLAVPGPGNALVTDPDSTDFAGGSLVFSISSGAVAGEDRVGFVGFNSQTANAISFSGSNIFYGSVLFATSSGTLTSKTYSFNANATPQMVTALIHQLVYIDTSDNPNTADRTMQYVLTDGDGGSTTAHSTVHVTAVNDNPVLDLDSTQPGTGTNNGLFEQDPTGAGSIAPNAVITDVDSANFDTGTLTVSLTANGQGGDQIEIIDGYTDLGNVHTVTTSGNQVLFDNVVVGTFTPGDSTTPLVVTFNANATPVAASWVTKAVNVVFTADDPSSAVRTLHYALTDGDGGSASANATYNVTAANDAPQLSAPTDASVSFTENGPAVAILQGVVLSDPDNPTNFSTGSIDIAVTGTAGQIDLKPGSNFTIHDNGNSTYTLMGPGNVAIGDITGFGTTHLQITNLTSAATPATLNDLVDDFTFSIAGDDVPNATGTVTLTFNDGHHTGYFGDGALTATQTQGIDVTGLNDAPVVDLGGTIGTGEDANQAWLSGMSVSDPDADPANDKIYVTFQVAHGVLDIRTDVAGGIDGSEVIAQSADTITVQATQNEINATLTAVNGLTYSPTPDYNGQDTLTVTANDAGYNGSDPGLTGDGTSEETVATRTIVVSAINDAPVVVNGTTEMAPAIDEDTPSATGNSVGFLFGGHYSDAADQVPGGSSAGAMGGIAVTGNTSTPSIGQWQYWNGASWTDIGAVSDSSALTLSAGTAIRFNPAPDYNGAAPQLTVHLADDTVSITDGAHIDLSVAGATGGTTAWSAGTVDLNETVNAVNDPPLVDLNGAAAGTSNSISYTEGDPVKLIAPSTTVTDVDSPNYANGVLTLSFTSNGTSDDQLIVIDHGILHTGDINVDEGSIYYQFGFVTGDGSAAHPYDYSNSDIRLVGTFFGGTGGSDLVITLTADATPTIAEKVLADIGYENISDAPSELTRTVTVTLAESDGATSVPATVTINVTGIDNPAVAQDDLVSTDEATIASGTVFANDFDTDGPPLQVATVNGSAANVGQTIVLASGATLKLNADGTFTYNPNHQFDTLTSPAGGESGASNTSATDHFTYTLVGGNGATVTVDIGGVANAADHLEGSNGNDTVTGTPNADYFDFTQGGSDSGFGLGGNDAFYFGTAYDQNDKVDGGAGIDTVGLRGNYTGAGGAVTILGGNMVNVETLSLMTSLTATPTGYDITWKDGNLATNQKMAIYAGNLQVGENATFDGSAEAHGYFVMYGGLGNDHFVGGSGSDGFYFGPGKFSQADFVDGGGGAQNQLGLDGSYNFSAASALGTLGGNFVNIQTIVLYGGDPRDVANPYPNVYHIETNDAAVAAGKTLNIYGVQTIGDFYFNGSAETDGAFKIFAGSGNDTLIGGAGNDLIFGGLGSDTLTGGGGNDVFTFTDVSQSIGANVDRITDFTLGDKIDLSQIDADTSQAGDQAFTFIGSGTFTNHAGELRAEYDAAHDVWTVQGDVNGDGITDITIVVHTIAAHPIVTTDFVL
ncbi:MAG TPA: tandem-95 repeat protein [Allosphingosinicella sp.]|jgi:hypothetical protein